jgi:hypothetical protein
MWSDCWQRVRKLIFRCLVWYCKGYCIFSTLHQKVLLRGAGREDKEKSFLACSSRLALVHAGYPPGYKATGHLPEKQGELFDDVEQLTGAEVLGLVVRSPVWASKGRYGCCRVTPGDWFARFGESMKSGQALIDHQPPEN